jgi:hypothetical protein
MNRLLVVASLVSFTMPFCAQGQHQNVAKLKADARNVVGIIGADKDKTPFVVVLRGLGTARTGAYFSTAPFIGSAAAVVLLGEPITAQLLLAAALMALGVWLHLTERHEHEHFHEASCTRILTCMTFTTGTPTRLVIRRVNHTRMLTSTAQCAIRIRTCRICITRTGTVNRVSVQ